MALTDVEKLLIATDALEYIEWIHECTCSPKTVEKDPCPSCMAIRALNEINKK